jgi:uncharacterized membrane protein YgdD (TMEM256/DUF423 family)
VFAGPSCCYGPEDQRKTEFFGEIGSGDPKPDRLLEDGGWLFLTVSLPHGRHFTVRVPSRSVHTLRTDFRGRSQEWAQTAVAYLLPHGIALFFLARISPTRIHRLSLLILLAGLTLFAGAFSARLYGIGRLALHHLAAAC